MNDFEKTLPIRNSAWRAVVSGIRTPPAGMIGGAGSAVNPLTAVSGSPVIARSYRFPGSSTKSLAAIKSIEDGGDLCRIATLFGYPQFIVNNGIKDRI
ncbi:MAG: hypothetical protein HQ483_15310 [Rhodospirillales bacterium]|nr:hypothetical protein [Rhodospirillales bacterium]